MMDPPSADAAAQVGSPRTHSVQQNSGGGSPQAPPRYTATSSCGRKPYFHEPHCPERPPCEPLPCSNKSQIPASLAHPFCKCIRTASCFHYTRLCSDVRKNCQ